MTILAWCPYCQHMTYQEVTESLIAKRTLCSECHYLLRSERKKKEGEK